MVAVARGIGIGLGVAAGLTAAACARPRPPATAPPPATLALAPCTIPGIPGIARSVRCGRFEVWEDRAARAGRKIALRVVVVPASGPDRAGDPIVPFAGGPGEAVVDDAGGAATTYAELNRRRDLVLIDVRGTGDSNSLACAALRTREGILGVLDGFLPVAGVKACRQALEPRAALAQYTTSNAVDDVDDALGALGYDRVNLVGASYGTFAALEYLRRHPARVRTVALEGVVPPDTRAPLYFASDAQRALEQQLAACAADAACHAAFPDPAGELQRLLAELERQPAPVTVPAAGTGKLLSFSLSRSAAAQAVRYLLYQPTSAAQIPLYVHLASQGDFRRLAESALLYGQLVSSLSDGFFLSVTCTEDVSQFSLDEATRAAAGTFLGDLRARAQKAACAEWPRGATPPDFTDPVRSGVPVLLVSGERDPVTPARWAAQAARTLSHATHVIIPGGSHGFGGLKGADCVDRLVTAFVERGTERDLDTRCVAAIEPVPFALHDERPAEVELAVAELDAFAGTYAGSDGEVVIFRADRVLHAALAGRPPFVLTPVGSARFRVDGAGPGVFIEFQRSGGAVVGAKIEQGSAAPLVLQRTPGH
jgi:pimeloyl-ACP methyl ester carboxylesterase